MIAILTVGAICEPDPPTICAAASLAQVVQLLASSYAEAVVAIASPAPRPTVIGILTYRDLLSSMTPGNALDTLHVLDVLNRNPLVLREEEDIETAILKLRRHGAKHAPVTGAGGTLRGVISMERLLGCRTARDAGQARPAAIVESTRK